MAGKGGWWPALPLTGDRGIFGGGYESDYINKIDYVNIASAGDSIDFGD